MDVAVRLRRNDPLMPPLAVGNLSAAGGGGVARHVSHQNGRDADLGFFLLDHVGRPMTSRRFVRIDAGGRGQLDGRRVLFDAKRNWALVKALLQESRFEAEVRYIFVSDGVKRRLLAQAARQREPQALQHRAARVLHEPRGDPHDQHFHVRIGCAPRDMVGGCLDL